MDLFRARVIGWAESSLYKPDIDILVLDGIPRNPRQADMLADYVEVRQVFHLSCPDRDEMMRRMRERALKDNRLDDAKEEVIRQRFRTYTESKKLLDSWGLSDLGISQSFDWTATRAGVFCPMAALLGRPRSALHDLPSALP